MSTQAPAATTPASKAVPPPRAEGGVLSRRRGTLATVIMALLALAWLFPLVWAVINSFRDYDYTQANGYLSFGG